VRLPSEFEEHMERRNWQPPETVDTAKLRIADDTE
jgi:hypothetical protein